MIGWGGGSSLTDLLLGCVGWRCEIGWGGVRLMMKDRVGVVGLRVLCVSLFRLIM